MAVAVTSGAWDQGEVAGGLDPDARGVTGQVGERDILDAGDLDCRRVGSRLDRLLARFGLGVRYSIAAGRAGLGIDAVSLTWDLGDSRADSVGRFELEVIGPAALGYADVP